MIKFTNRQIESLVNHLKTKEITLNVTDSHPFENQSLYGNRVLKTNCIKKDGDEWLLSRGFIYIHKKRNFRNNQSTKKETFYSVSYEVLGKVRRKYHRSFEDGVIHKEYYFTSNFKEFLKLIEAISFSKY